MDDSKPVEVEIEEGQDISDLLFFGTEDAYETSLSSLESQAAMSQLSSS